MNTASPQKALVARLLAAIAATGLTASVATADTLYWDGPSASWTTLSAWSTAAGADTPDPLAIPGASDDVVFNISTYNTNNLIGMGSANHSVNSVTFGSTGTTRIGNGGGNRDLTVGAGGITVNSGAGASQIGDSGSGNNVFVRLGASQTWTNNSTAGFTSRNVTTGLATGTAPVTLTLSATNTGGITNSGLLHDGAEGAVVSLVVNSSGTGVSSNSGGTYSGGTTILAGTLSASGTTALGAGSGAVLLGDTTGSAAATLSLNVNSTTVGLANNITVRSGSSGVKTLTATSNSILNGTLALDDNLTVNPTSGTATLNGVISGSGAITKTGGGALLLAGNNTFSGGVVMGSNSILRINNGGTGPTNSALGTGTLSSTGSFTLDNTSGSDVTLATNNALTLNGTLSFTGTNSLNLGTGDVSFGASTRAISVAANKLTIGGVISATGTAGLSKQGNGTLALTGFNTYTGITQIGPSGQSNGVLEVTHLADGGQASSIGASGNGAGNLVFGGVGGAGTLRYVGAGDSTNRLFGIGSVGAMFDASGTGAVKFTNTGAANLVGTNTARTITFRGTNTDDNTMSVSIGNNGTGPTAISKQDAGRWILAGNNTFTGDITIDSGTLELGSSTGAGNGANLVLNGGTFATGGFDETLGTLAVNGNATIDFGSSNVSDLVFAASDGVSWGASVSLSILNFTEGFDTIRFGTTNEGLSLGQLGKITINGFAAAIDEQGFLSVSAVPEPSSFAAFAGLSILGFAASRRRRAA